MIVEHHHDGIELWPDAGRRAIAGSRSWEISLWDALIIRAAEVAGCAVVLSEDLADGATYGLIGVSNPLA